MEYFNRVSSKHMDGTIYLIIYLPFYPSNLSLSIAGFYMGEILMGLGKNDPNNLSRVLHPPTSNTPLNEDSNHHPGINIAISLSINLSNYL
jgi:hypothetical protein